MVVITIVLVSIAIVDVVRRPRATWTRDRDRAVWLALLSVPIAVTLLSFSAAGPVVALVVLVAYMAFHRGRLAPGH